MLGDFEGFQSMRKRRLSRDRRTALTRKRRKQMKENLMILFSLFVRDVLSVFKGCSKVS